MDVFFDELRAIGGVPCMRYLPHYLHPLIFHFRDCGIFTPMANTCPREDRHHQLEEMFKKHVLAEAGSPSSKAAAILTRGAYMEYVSTAQWRERRWRLFSTFLFNLNGVRGG